MIGPAIQEIAAGGKAIVIDVSLDAIAGRCGGEHIGDEAFVPAADLVIQAPAVIRTPVPGERLAPIPRVPAPLDLMPQEIDAPAQPPLSHRVAVEILLGAEEPLKQKRRLDQIGAIILAPERNGGAGGSIDEMRIDAVIAGRA